MNDLLTLAANFRAAQKRYFSAPYKPNLALAKAAVLAFDEAAADPLPADDPRFQIREAGLFVRRLQARFKLTGTTDDQRKMLRAQSRFDELLKIKNREAELERVFGSMIGENRS